MSGASSGASSVAYMGQSKISALLHAVFFHTKDQTWEVAKMESQIWIFLLLILPSPLMAATAGPHYDDDDDTRE